jgi:hypothetical protein
MVIIFSVFLPMRILSWGIFPIIACPIGDLTDTAKTT